MSETKLSDEQILALMDFLKSVPLFAELDAEDLAALVPLVKYDDYQAGDVLFRQADADDQLYVLQTGSVQLVHIDPNGVAKDAGVRTTGTMLGESSLLLGEPHDVSAHAQTPVTALVFKRDEFRALREGNRRLWGKLTPTEGVARRLRAPKFGWQAPDEVVVIFAREHWWGLVRRAFFPLLALVVLIAAIEVIAQALPGLITFAVIVGGVALLGVITYVVIDWRNDFWVVTNQRIVHSDEIMLIRKKRQEAPLQSISEIQYSRDGLVAAFFDFGDLEVSTFTGTLGMRDIPHAQDIKQLVQDEIEKIRSRARASERKKIRTDLSKRIIADQPIIAPAPPVSAVPAGRRARSVFVLSGVFRYFFPKLVEVRGDTIIWRKHWIVLWRTLIWPTLVWPLVVWAILNWYTRTPPLGTLFEDTAWWVFLLAFAGVTSWWLWLFEDWRNDEYMVTPTEIVDLQRTPFALSEKRQTSPLSNFQSTELKVVGPIQKIMRYGTLVVKVPGSSIDFQYIKDPAGAQAEITKRLAAFNKRKQAAEAEGRRNELSDWLAAYDQIRFGPRTRPPVPAPPAKSGESKS